uniref:Uncharacterized protein n=1 Tax=Picea sitchensis TaxID=3332 RepID=A0A6B9XUF4_PICSI|nr:hypothetical protein Q903MT_gene5774 [Picea sitchensis]
MKLAATFLNNRSRLSLYLFIYLSLLNNKEDVRIKQIGRLEPGTEPDLQSYMLAFSSDQAQINK